MKKIKTNLVTFVTDNVLLFTYFGNKISCAHAASKMTRPHRERKRKRWRCDNSRGNSADLRRSAKIGVGDRKHKMPDVAFGGAFLVGRAESFCARPNTADDSRHRSGSACVSERLHRTIYGLDESHSLMETASRVRRRTNVLREHNP
jgi:hypothetical protein